MLWQCEVCKEVSGNVERNYARKRRSRFCRVCDQETSHVSVRNK